jgi:predicted nucleic acid-binding protein
MLTHVLDTSAWLAHLFKEPGARQITRLFKEPNNRVGVSVLSLVEVYTRLRAVGREKEFKRTVEYYGILFTSFVPVSESIAHQAITLRSSATSRLPTIDSLIAATAAHHGAILVHRDPHFLALPGDEVKQELLATEG